MQNQTASDFDIHEILHPEVFPHSVDNIELIETHISWVVLTGQFAYKIKKPVRFDFVDYSTLERRKSYCEKELQLNRRLAPQLYLDVVAISNVAGQLRMDDTSNPVEFAVKMKQFRQEAILANHLKGHSLPSDAVEAFGRDVAKFHRLIPSADITRECVQVHHIGADANANFTMLFEAFIQDRRQNCLNELHEWTRRSFTDLQSSFARRLADGHVRLCHGDMHLNNIIVRDRKLVAFDGIEFNEELQWIDCTSEIAFTVMDFSACGKADLGWRFLNAYLEATGDYAGLEVLRFYLVYRAMVRAKVAWLNPLNHVPILPRPMVRQIGPWDCYLQTALRFAFPVEPCLAITHGLSGSGKSTAAMQFAISNSAIRIRSDVERDRLPGIPSSAGKYDLFSKVRVYQGLLELAESSLANGFSVVVDATFLDRESRSMFRSLAERLGVSFSILNCTADYEELCRRIGGRRGDASEATIDVLNKQINTQDPLTQEEMSFAVHSKSRTHA